MGLVCVLNHVAWVWFLRVPFYDSDLTLTLNPTNKLSSAKLLFCFNFQCASASLKLLKM